MCRLCRVQSGSHCRFHRRRNGRRCRRAAVCIHALLPDHGFSGFSEMQRLFRDSYVGGWPDYATRLDHLREKGDESASGLLAEFVEAGRSSLEMLLKSVDTRQLDEAVSALAQARTVHIIGLRRSFPIASYLAYAFEKMKVPAVLHSAVGGLGNLSAISRDDALIAITFSPIRRKRWNWPRWPAPTAFPLSPCPIWPSIRCASPARRYSR